MSTSCDVARTRPLARPVHVRRGELRRPADQRGVRPRSRLRRRQDDHRAPRPADPSLRHRRNRQRELPFQEQALSSLRPNDPEPARLRNPDQLRRAASSPRDILRGSTLGSDSISLQIGGDLALFSRRNHRDGSGSSAFQACAVGFCRHPVRDRRRSRHRQRSCHGVFGRLPIVRILLATCPEPILATGLRSPNCRPACRPQD